MKADQFLSIQGSDSAPIFINIDHIISVRFVDDNLVLRMSNGDENTLVGVGGVQFAAHIAKHSIECDGNQATLVAESISKAIAKHLKSESSS